MKIETIKKANILLDNIDKVDFLMRDYVHIGIFTNQDRGPQSSELAGEVASILIGVIKTELPKLRTKYQKQLEEL